MKFTLIQQASDGHANMLASVILWHAEYAKRHDIIYKVSFGDVVPERQRNWGRFPLLIEALKAGYADVVVWMDADAVIADGTVSLKAAANEFMLLGTVRHPEPWHEKPYHQNMGVMFLRRHDRTIQFLEEVNRLGKIEGEKWENQGTIFTVAEQLKFPICRIGNRWNSTRGQNECENPVVMGFHGTGTTHHAEIEAIAKRNL